MNHQGRDFTGGRRASNETTRWILMVESLIETNNNFMTILLNF